MDCWADAILLLWAPCEAFELRNLGILLRHTWRMCRRKKKEKRKPALIDLFEIHFYEANTNRGVARREREQLCGKMVKKR